MKSTVNYNKSRIFSRAWKTFKSGEYSTFGDALRASWNIEKNGVSTITIDYVYNTYYNQIFNFINSQINYKSDDAQEIAQDVFIKFNEKISEYDVNKSKVSYYLFYIARNKVIDYYRKNKNANNVTHIGNYTDDNGNDTLQIEAEYYNADNVDSKETNNTIEHAMSLLSEKQQRIATLFFIEDKMYKEIAEIMDIPMNTVKVTIVRIREKLQANLKDVRTM